MKVTDIKGDLHSHTIASDGRGTIEEMARAASKAGLKYLAITDHSASHGFGDHVSARRAEARRSSGSGRSTPQSTGSPCWPGPR